MGATDRALLHARALVLGPAPVHLFLCTAGEETLFPVSRSVGGHMAAEAHLDVTLTAQGAREPGPVRNRLYVVLVDWVRGEGHRVILVVVMGVLGGQGQGAIQCGLAVRARAHLVALALVRVQGRCRIHPTRDIAAAEAAPDRSVGEGEVIVVMTLGTVGPDHRGRCRSS